MLLKKRFLILVNPSAKLLTKWASNILRILPGCLGSMLARHPMNTDRLIDCGPCAASFNIVLRKSGITMKHIILALIIVTFSLLEIKAQVPEKPSNQSSADTGR